MVKESIVIPQLIALSIEDEKIDDADRLFYRGMMYYRGYGVEQNKCKAKKWLLKAAEQNHSDALYQLGYMYYNGDGIKKNESMGTVFFRKAAMQDNREAQFVLGQIYYYGNEMIEKDLCFSFHWFNVASKQKHTEALYYLGKMCYKGEYVMKNKEKAYFWFTLAEKLGLERAIKARETLEKQLDEQKISNIKEKAQDWLLY